MPRAQRTILYRRSNGHPLSLRDDNLIGSGGEGVIFALDELPDLAAKLYRRPDEAIGAKLALMVDSPPDIESRGGHVSIAWPLDTLHSALPASRENTVGFLMHRIRSMQPVIQCYSPLARRQKFPHFTYKHLCAVAINTAIAVNAIHAQNYVIGDLNETNILVNDNGLVTLIDTDSLQVIDQRGGTVHRSPVGKPEYTPAELQGHRFDEVDRDQYHDRFGLGVIIYQLLMEGSHPFAGMYMGEGEPPAIEGNISRGNFLHSENSAISLVEGPGYMRWDTLDGAVRDLFRLCFDVGHDRRTVRPTPDMWEDAITQAAGSESLATCRQNPQHLYFRHNRSCPWCGRRNMTRGKDPFPRHSMASMPALVMRQVPTPVATPQVVTPSAQLAPHLKHIELKIYMLELINAEREKVGLNHLVLGQNNGAQLKADAALMGCHSSHWELSGLNPWMRYHLEGGYQSMGENAAGANWCLTEADGYAPIRDVRRLVEQYMNSWMDSPAHRGSILHRWNRKVNIGLAWNRYNSVAYQQFEGDYVEFSRLPSIENGILSFSGRTKPPVRFRKESDLNISLQYHQPPRALTVGQIMSVYSYGTETHIASFRWPLKPGWGYPDSEFSYVYTSWLDPYDLPADAPTPRPNRDVAKEWRKKHGYELTVERHVTVPWVTALEWVASDDTFHFKADITDLLDKYGSGVYRVTLGGPVSDDQGMEFSSYSFFHDIEGYD